jgi:hypothetical protein
MVKDVNRLSLPPQSRRTQIIQFAEPVPEPFMSFLFATFCYW